MSDFKIGKNCKIHPSAIINVLHGYLGAGSIVSEGARIEGTRVEIGREAFLDRGATIGGGSCFDPQAILRAGDWLHMGVQSHINIACGVSIGHEFGCGIETKIFTHGAYTDSYNLGAPVQWQGVEIGDHVWMPNAWVNPGVKVGANVIITPRSLLKGEIPSGCLAGGAPAKIIRENFLPRDLQLEERHKHIQQIFDQARARHGALRGELQIASEPHQFKVIDAGTAVLFSLKEKIIAGPVTDLTELFKDQLRRNGIRFRYHSQGSQWTQWGDDPVSF